jgi:hypothetical protein
VKTKNVRDISVRMNKRQGILSGIVLMLLFTGIALATSNSLSDSSDVETSALDQKLTGWSYGNEWISYHNPSNESADIGSWVLETSECEKKTIPGGTIFYYLLLGDT